MDRLSKDTIFSPHFYNDHYFSFSISVSRDLHNSHVENSNDLATLQQQCVYHSNISRELEHSSEKLENVENFILESFFFQEANILELANVRKQSKSCYMRSLTQKQVDKF